MQQNFELCLSMLLAHEGGFVNHPDDPGGMTNLGVTKRVLDEYLTEQEGSPMDVSEEIMRSLTPELVAPLYKQRYWDKVRGDDLPTGLDWCVFDWAVNSGPRRSAKALQEIIGATADGLIGPATLRQVAKFNASELALEMFNKRQSFYESLKTFDTFGKGWTRRNAETLDQAMEMIKSGSNNS